MSTEQTLSEIGGAAFDPESSRFIRTSWMLDVRRAISIPSVFATVRYLDSNEALRLEDTTARRNVFSRHSYERDFYLNRIREFSERSVIEVIAPGDPKTIVTQARRTTSIVEAACVVSTVLYASRTALHSRLGITAHRKDVLDFTIGPGYRHLSTSSKRETPVHGVLVDKTFASRFHRLGLEGVVCQAAQESPLGRRLHQALLWLLESRLEHSPGAAIVKAAIAFEVLLGSNESEPLRRTLSERAAFLLSDDSETREAVSSAVKSFYDARSLVVHGGTRKKARATPAELLEAAERILFLVIVTLSSNSDEMASDVAAQQWMERQRWGANQPLARPFRPGDLKRALQRATRAKQV